MSSPSPSSPLSPTSPTPASSSSRRLPIGPSSPPLSRSEDQPQQSPATPVTPVRSPTTASSHSNSLTSPPRTPKLELQVPTDSSRSTTLRSLMSAGARGGNGNGFLNSASTSSPVSARAASTPTHAGGILPPASFFRPTKPNTNASGSRPPSNYSLGPSTPVKMSPIGGIGIGLPFKATITTPTTSNKPSALPTSAPGALKANVGLSAKMGKPNSREPLLPIGEKAGTTSTGTGRSTPQRMPIGPEPVVPSAAPVTPVRAGVRGSFERIWRRGSHGAGPSTPARKEEVDDDDVDDVDEQERAVSRASQDIEMKESASAFEQDLEAAAETVQEDRNRYVQEDSAQMEDPRHLSVEDIGDGALGGGVVMEMGRISHDVPNPNTHNNTHDFEERELDEAPSPLPATPDVPVFARPPPLKGPSMDESRLSSPVQRRSNDARLATPKRPPMPETPQSRHARFAPSPPKSPKTIGTSELTSPSTTASSSSHKTSHSLFHWRRHRAAVPDASWMVPVMSPSTGKPLRNYEFHPSSNGFFVKGHVVTGGDAAWPFLGALSLVLGIAGTWFGTTCVFWWRRGSGGQAVAVVGAYLCLLTLASMFMTAFRDPGILPRDLDPDPPYPPTSSTASLQATPMPLPRDLRVRNGSVRVKYCVTCKTYRPPRSSHCKMCDNCVDGCDHHCQWVNNCVGRRNYTYFITFVVTASITAILVLITAVLQVYLESRDHHYGAGEAIKHAIGSTVAACLCIIVIWPLMALALYHVRLLFLNITTIEQVRNQAHRKLTKTATPPNAFSIGNWFRNMAYLLCRPAGYDWVDLSGNAMHDTRKINPGFVVRPASAADMTTSEDQDETMENSRDEDWR